MAMNHGDYAFKMSKREQSVLFGFMGLGVVCILLTILGDDALYSRFWSNYLINTVFFTGIAFVALFVLAAFTTAYAGWHTVVKRIWEGYSLFLIVGIVLFLVIIAGMWGHLHHLYHWTDPEEVAKDPVLLGKSGFLNKYWYTFGTLIILAVWYFLFARPMHKLSVSEDEQEGAEGFRKYKKYKVYAAIFLPVGGFTSAALIWQWVMSVDAHWYSTLFAWYTTASWFVACMALTILMVTYLRSRGSMPFITVEHLHDLGKYLFAFSIFWTYLWFSQYMLIWYGNIGEETIYFHTRVNEYPVLFYGNLVINFVLPFFVLMRNDTKRKLGSLLFIAVIVLFGRFLDFFLMVKPGVLHTTHDVLGHAEGADAAHGAFVAGFSMPGLLEIGTFLGFLALFIFFVFKRLEKVSLLPKNDPFLAESLHHHVQ
jgi:hypothetical protein